MDAIRVEGLTKVYGTVRAVDGISFCVGAGEVFGLLGPNGAGKTTTVEILEGLRTADAGSVGVLGVGVDRKQSPPKERIGIALQTATLLQNLTPRELIELFGSFYPRPVPAQSLIERLGLADRADARVQTLSGGQQQRLSVALALVNDPDLVFLDEPTTGLDPQARRGVWDLIGELRQAGKTVVLTTHYMEEAERLCDRVAIVDHGRILAMDPPDRLIGTEFPERAIQFEAPEGVTPDALAPLPGVSRAAAEDGDIVLYSTSVQDTLSGLLQAARDRQWDLGEVRIRRATLEDVFLKLTGRRMRE